MKGKFCANCGSPLEIEDRICPQCGTPIPKIQKTAGAVSEPAEAARSATPSDSEMAAESTTSKALEEKVKGKQKKKHKKRGKKWILILVIVLLLAMLLSVYAGVRYIKKLCFTPAATSDANEDGHFSVVLSVDQPSLTIGKSYDLTFTARVYDDLPGLAGADEISIIDDEGNVLVQQSLTEVKTANENGSVGTEATAEAESIGVKSTGIVADSRGYTEYILPYSFTPTDDEGLVCRAKIAGLESEPLNIYAATEITLDMVMTCMEVGEDLEEWIAENDIETDLSDKEILEKVLGWLENDPRVGDAVINAQNVIFATTDHVGGMYILPGDGTCFGSESDGYEDSDKVAELAYRRQEESGSVSAEDGKYLYLDGKNSITNTKILLLNPAQNISDPTLQESFDNYVKMAGEYENVGFQTAVQSEDGDAINKLIYGEICEYGIVNMICHGNYYYNSDGGYTNCYQLARVGVESEEEVRKIMTNLFVNKMNIDEPADFKDLYCNPEKPENCLFFISTGRQLILSSNGLKLSLQDKYFDNTILYFGSCYGMLGEGLSEFLLSHGAKLVIGWNSAAICTVEQYTYKHVFKELCKLTNDGATMPVSDLTDGFCASWNAGIGTVFYSFTDIFTHLHNLYVGDRNDEMEIMPNIHRLSAMFFYDSPDFTIKDYGTLNGNVEIEQHTITYHADGETEDNEVLEPAKNVKITLERFLNQSFAESNNEDAQKVETVTDENGSFSFTDLRWAVYGIDLTGNEIVNDKTAVTVSDKKFDEKKIQVLRNGASASGVVRVINRSKIKQDSEGNILTDTAELYALSEEPENLNVLFILTEAELETEKDLVGEIYKPDISADHYSIKDLPGGSYIVQIGCNEMAETLNLSMKLENGHDYVFDECPEYLVIGDLVQDALVLESSKEDYTYEIPEILLGSDEIQGLNADLMNNYGSIAKEAINLYRDKTPSGGIHYEWWTNQDVLTLYIWNYDYPDLSGCDVPEIISVSISGQKELTRAEILEIYGLSEDEFSLRCRDAMKKYFLNTYGEWMDQDLDPFPQRQLARTISDSNVQMAQPYVGEDGCLWILFREYALAGRNYYLEMVSLGVAME